MNSIYLLTLLTTMLTKKYHRDEITQNEYELHRIKTLRADYLLHLTIDDEVDSKTNLIITSNCYSTKEKYKYLLKAQEKLKQYCIN